MKKQILTIITFCFFLHIQAQLPSFVPTNGLLEYFSLEDTAVGYNDNEIRTFSSSGTETIPIFSPSVRAAGKSMLITSNQYIDSTEILDLPQGNADRSFSFWYTKGSGSKDLLSYSLDNNTFLIRDNGSSISVSNGTSTVQYDTILPYLFWMHIGVTHESGVTKIYINGQEYASGNITFNNNTSTITSGKSPSSPYSVTAGSTGFVMDDVFIYDRALSASEMLSFFNNPLFIYIEPPYTGDFYRVCENDTIKFSGKANDVSPAVSYQWTYNGVDIVDNTYFSNAQTSELSVHPGDSIFAGSINLRMERGAEVVNSIYNYQLRVIANSAPNTFYIYFCNKESFTISANADGGPFDETLKGIWSAPLQWTTSSNFNFAEFANSDTSFLSGVVSVDLYGGLCFTDTVTRTINVTYNGLEVDENFIQRNGNTLSTADDYEYYEWYLFSNNVYTSVSTDATYTVTETGEYFVEVVSEFSCSALTSITIESLDGVSIKDINEAIQFTIYPNPTKGNVSIANVALGSEVSVKDVTGKVLFETKVANEIETFDVQNFANGIYFVNVFENGRFMGSTKLVVSK